MTSFRCSPSRSALRARLCTLAFALALASPAVQAQSSQEPVLRYGIDMELATLDPVRVSNFWETMAAVNLYDTLVFPDAEKGLVPRIAASWEISPDRTVYTFKLRNDVPFHDGSPVTAEDVAFSMRRTLSMPGLAASYLRRVDRDRIEMPDPHTVRFTLTEPDPAFLRALLYLKVLNRKVVLANKEAGTYGEFGDYGAKYLLTHDAGSGPYMLTAFPNANTAVLSRFDKYPFVQWKPNAPRQIRLSIIPEAVTNVAKLRAGEIDVGPVSLPPQILKSLESDKRLAVERHPQLATYYVAMNNTRPPLDDVHVRQAISYAYDANTVMNRILSGGVPVQGPVPPQLLGPCEGVATYAFDMEKARQALARSKYTPQQLQAFNMDIAAVAANETFKNIGLLLSINLKKLGLNAQVKPVRWADIVQAQTKPDTAFDFVIYYDTARLGHASQLLMYYTKEGWGSAYPGGGIYWRNDKVDELLKQAALQDDNSAGQKQAYCEADRLIAAEAPAIFSNAQVRTIPHWGYLTGFKADAGAPYFDLRFENYEFDMKDPAYLKNHGG